MSCLTYRQLFKMYQDANWAHDFYWNEGIYDESIRYTKIAQRILQSISKYKTNFYA